MFNFYLFKIFAGIGFASMMVSFLVCVYYNIIIAWCLYFLALSFRKEVLWKDCGNWWNSESCYAGRIPDNKHCVNETLVNGSALMNATAANCTLREYISPPKEFWE